MRLPSTGVRLPWQLVELHEPGPLYWPGTPAAAVRPAGFCERVSPANQFASGNTAKRRDRKSTRLNSSHSQISYAVFCLKKKKEDPQPTATQLMTEENLIYEKVLQKQSGHHDNKKKDSEADFADEDTQASSNHPEVVASVVG